MKNLVVVCICWLLMTPAFGQVGNEWIDFNQTYFKIPVAKQGIYKLDHTILQAAGFETGADPRYIQLFHRGVEQSIYVAGENDSQFNTSDFIEFYGQRNDGTLDSDLYDSASWQPHSYYNLYNDTTSYFLTIGSAVGKRMVSLTEANGGLPVETFHIDEKLSVFTNQYYTGPDYDIEVQYSRFDNGEGWTGTQVVNGNSITNSFTGIVNAATTASDPILELVIVGRGTMNHVANVYAGGNFVGSVNFTGVKPYRFSKPVSWASVAGDGSLAIRLEVVGSGGPDRMSISSMILRYPQQLNNSGQSEKVFTLPANVFGKSYIEIQNPVSNLRLFDITDPNTVSQVGTTSTGTLNAVVPNTTVSRKIYASSITIAPKVKPIRFRQIFPASHDYLIITHPALRKPAGGYADPVKAYADYRASSEGGSYDTLVVNIGQLYDQFNYGETSPRAVFQFMKYFKATKLPKYLFIVGKGLTVNYSYYRNPNSSSFNTYRDFVPTAGMPGSDMYFTADRTKGAEDPAPAVATGRIPAVKPADVVAYLNKVKETEARPFDDLRRKHVLHLSGGIEAGEPAYFRSILEGYAPIAKGVYLGGHVSAIAKQSTDIQLINIAEEVNKGLSLVTFFGHSSAVNLDFDIGYVTNPLLGYNNPGKYPMMIMNGCNAGSFFLNFAIFGEDWITAPNKGAVGFIAHSSYGLVNYLQYYSNTFYNVAFADSSYIHRGIGDIQKEVARRFIDSNGASIISTTQVQQMVLMGDPAVPLFGAKKSDLEINSNNVTVESFTGEPVTAFTDSFAIKLVVRNFGQARKDTMEIQVKRYLNDNTLITYDSLYNSVWYSDTLTFVIRKDRENGGGNNRFEIIIDPNNVIDELSETNNHTEVEIPISMNGTKNLFPVDFSIVSSSDVTLSFQATDLLSGERDFIVQIDTVDTFDSPYKKEYALKGTVVGRRTVPLIAPSDTLAYYWRTRLATPLPGENQAWTVSSFTFINDGPEGWAQVHFPQFLDDQPEGLVPDVTLRKFYYKETITAIDVKTFGSTSSSTYLDLSVKINGAEYSLYTQGFGCRYNTLNLIAFDRRSTVPYSAMPLKWYENGGLNCGREPLVINSFYYTEMAKGSRDVAQYVNAVAVGDSVLLYNLGNAYYELWPMAAKLKLGELGISLAQIDALQPGEPVVIFGRKGSPPGTARILKTSATPASGQVLTVNETITGRYTNGSLSSRTIGPASSWEAFSMKTKMKEVQDSVLFDLKGITLKGEEVLLFSNLKGNRSLADVNAANYPYVKLVYKTEDDINLTPAQLRNWFVVYTPVPEGVLIYKGSPLQQTINEGEQWIGNYGFVNVGGKIFGDSLVVQYELYNQSRHESFSVTRRIKAPAIGDTTQFQIQFDTSDKTGLNDITVFINPRVIPEQYYDNNVLVLSAHLNVGTDVFKPVLDVTVDNRHVEHGDFVSPNPVVLIKVWDENKNVLKTDTTGVRIFLTYPCVEVDNTPCTPSPIWLRRPNVTWSPATLSSDFNVVFKPANLPEGKYVLRVEAADGKNNASGLVPYEIDFVVDSKLTINVSEPYPNPSTSDVYFNAVLGGMELPESFGLDIVDLAGKRVRTFDMNDVKDFHIGINYLHWNGSDANGNRMPPGIYIYKLTIVMQGVQVVRNGKIVLLR